MINVGDKVSFLNDKLDGVVRAIGVDGLIKVEITDGFIIDALVKDLVITEKFISVVKPDVTSEAVIPAKKAVPFIIKNDTLVFFAAAMQQQQVLTGMVSYILCNETGCNVLYSFAALKKNKPEWLAHGILTKGSQVTLCTQSRESMIDWEHFTLQFILADGHKTERPVSRDMPILLPDLSTTFMSGNTTLFARQIVLADLNLREEMDTEILKQRLETKTVTHKKFESPLSALKEKSKTVNYSSVLLNSKEVDLHIEELTQDFINLTNAEMLNIQLAAIRREMDHALLNGYKSVVFIHGVGNGKLKQELRNELKNYPSLTWRDASHEKFGNGATEVTL